jgi:eukaryotic-like serine/threonine-protein kinase
MIGTKLAHYEVTSHLGSGGMGDVYQATDTRLSRSVAIKLLPESFAHDTDRTARFDREARVLASLNHPNIAAIYGLENARDQKFLVMELVPGETLADRIQRGPIPIAEALEIARQIAEALEAAHEKGIVHRDLKPANIKVTADDKVKVLDFGLAKAYEQEPSASPHSNSPTLNAAATNAGMILGTAAYMSPEQAVGKPVDKRSDLWSFGVVLQEMLTGRQLFHGETVSHLLASVLKDAPDWTSLPSETPDGIRKLLRRCLEKDRKKRIADAADVRLEIEDALAPASPAEATPLRAAPNPGSRLNWILLASALVVIAVLAIPAARHLRETAPPEMRLDIVTPATDNPESFAVSPDGRYVVYVASADGGAGGSRLWLRSLSATAAQPLAGTDGAVFPFWSPDSHSIGFFADGSLKRVDVGSNTPKTLAPAQTGGGGSWNSDGIILFAPTLTGPLMRIAAAGGTATAATTFGKQHSGHLEPWFLPDGKRFLFYVRGSPEVSGIYLGTLDGSAPTRVTAADSAGVYHPAGWLLRVRSDGALVAERLDTTQAKLTGESLTLAEGVVDNGRNRSGISVTATGLLAYRVGEAVRRQLVWTDRTGKVQETMGQPDTSILNPSVAPGSHRVVISRTVQGNIDIWLVDGLRMSRVTTDAATEMFPIWSYDGKQVVFRSIRSGAGELYLTSPSGGGTDQRIVASDQLLTPTSWSADGRFLMYMTNNPQTGMDLMVMPMFGDRKPFVFVKTPFREVYGAFSPDGKWVAYQSNVSGRPEIYLRPFVPPNAAAPAEAAEGEQHQVSSAGGISPLWRADGKELYYLSPSGAMMAVSVNIKGSAIDLGAPVQLFATHVSGGGVDTQQGRQYGVASDGMFVINTELRGESGPITLIQNWDSQGKK